MEKSTKEILTSMLAIEESTLKAQRAFAMNTEMNYIWASVTEARIKAIKKQLSK
jgi:hypothetical protein